MPDALGALHRIDFIEFDALRNGLVGAFRLACTTIDAFICNLKTHEATIGNPSKIVN